MSSQCRHVYTREQRTILEASFTRQSHPNIDEKERLAILLSCNIIQISNWFQNHRRRIKKQRKSLVTVNIPTPSQTSFIYHQPYCPFTMNNNHSSCYYYPPQYIYCHEPFYMVNYEQ